MSALEQPALPFHENTDLVDARAPWMTFEEVANKVYFNTDESLDEFKRMSMEPIQPHEIDMDTKTKENAFARKVLAFVKRCDEINFEHIDDSEKYHTVRHSMALRVIGLYFDTQHYIDARSELSVLRTELKNVTPDDPLIPFVESAYRSVGMISRTRDSEPPQNIGYIQPYLFDK